MQKLFSWLRGTQKKNCKKQGKSTCSSNKTIPDTGQLEGDVTIIPQHETKANKKSWLRGKRKTNCKRQGKSKCSSNKTLPDTGTLEGDVTIIPHQTKANKKSWLRGKRKTNCKKQGKLKCSSNKTLPDTGKLEGDVTIITQHQTKANKKNGVFYRRKKRQNTRYGERVGGEIKASTRVFIKTIKNFFCISHHTDERKISVQDMYEIHKSLQSEPGPSSSYTAVITTNPYQCSKDNLKTDAMVQRSSEQYLSSTFVNVSSNEAIKMTMKRPCYFKTHDCSDSSTLQDPSTFSSFCSEVSALSLSEVSLENGCLFNHCSQQLNTTTTQCAIQGTVHSSEDTMMHIPDLVEKCDIGSSVVCDESDMSTRDSFRRQVLMVPLNNCSRHDTKEPAIKFSKTINVVDEPHGIIRASDEKCGLVVLETNKKVHKHAYDCGDEMSTLGKLDISIPVCFRIDGNGCDPEWTNDKDFLKDNCSVLENDNPYREFKYQNVRQDKTSVKDLKRKPYIEDGGGPIAFDTEIENNQNQDDTPLNVPRSRKLNPEHPNLSNVVKNKRQEKIKNSSRMFRVKRFTQANWSTITDQNCKHIFMLLLFAQQIKPFHGKVIQNVTSLIENDISSKPYVFDDLLKYAGVLLGIVSIICCGYFWKRLNDQIRQGGNIEQIVSEDGLVPNYEADEAPRHGLPLLQDAGFPDVEAVVREDADFHIRQPVLYIVRGDETFPMQCEEDLIERGMYNARNGILPPQGAMPMIDLHPELGEYSIER